MRESCDQDAEQDRSKQGACIVKALVYHGPGRIAWEDKPVPAIQEPDDAIVAISALVGRVGTTTVKSGVQTATHDSPIQ